MILFFIAVVLLLGYYLLIRFYQNAWTNIPVFDTHLLAGIIPSEKITVIVPARNEEAVIENCIRSLLQQSYPKHLLEIIIVDDHSTDHTSTIIRQYKNEGIKLLSLKNTLTGNKKVTAYKKKAIEAAIDESTGTLIVTTDADCTAGIDWISTIAAFHFYSKATFIVAPVKIKASKSLLSFFQGIDFAILQGITAAAVYKKFHSMCNGANLVYEKTAFNEVNGFENIDHIASGDDMLLMHKIYSKHPDGIAYLNSPAAIVETLPAPDLKTFFRQRIRWASKAGKYKDKRIVFVLLLVYLLNLCIFLLLAGSIWQPAWFLLFFILVFYKTIIEWGFVKAVLKYFSLHRLMPLFPLFQPFHIIYTIIAGFFGSFGTYEWKGRKVR